MGSQNAQFDATKCNIPRAKFAARALTENPQPLRVIAAQMLSFVKCGPARADSTSADRGALPTPQP
jgi:hypothetical protein